MPVNSIERIDNFISNLSSRISKESDSILEYFPPFLAFQLDIKNRKKIGDADSRKVKLVIYLNKFAALKYIAKFNKPL